MLLMRASVSSLCVSVSVPFPRFPIRVRSSGLSRRSKLTYSGKYCCHVLKVQLIASHTEVPLWFSGPWLGIDHDSRIWAEHPCPELDDDEKLLAGTVMLLTLRPCCLYYSLFVDVLVGRCEHDSKCRCSLLFRLRCKIAHVMPM